MKSLNLESEIRVADEIKQFASSFLQKHATLIPTESAQKIRSKLQEMQRKLDVHKRKLNQQNYKETAGQFKKKKSTSTIAENKDVSFKEK